MTLPLQVVEVDKAYGALRVLTRICIDVRTGEVVGIVGPNGAGKTTLLDVVAGEQRGDHGRILLDGTDVTAMSPARRCRLGLARTFQVPRPLGDLTVFEVALLGASRGAGLRGTPAYAAAERALALAGLTGVANAASASLRLLDRKRLELARALATGPRVLLLDEIAGGLSDVETAELVGTLRAVNDAGTTVVWVEHVLRILTQLATRLVCLADGRVLADGPPDEVLASAAVRAAYLGGSVL
jgi:branched-chain amino acid transport system ATP-binding protein